MSNKWLSLQPRSQWTQKCFTFCIPFPFIGKLSGLHVSTQTQLVPLLKPELYRYLLPNALTIQIQCFLDQISHPSFHQLAFRLDKTRSYQNFNQGWYFKTSSACTTCDVLVAFIISEWSLEIKSKPWAVSELAAVATAYVSCLCALKHRRPIAVATVDNSDLDSTPTYSNKKYLNL